MTLNSFLFLLAFLPLAVLGAHLLRDRWSVRASQLWILACSIVFYVSNGPANFALLAGSILFNWSITRSLASEKISATGRKRVFVFGVLANVVLLCVYKYTNAIAVEAGLLFGLTLTPPAIGFPLGLSFFTLTQVMYLVDCYERMVPANSLVNHATFVSFFPNVTAGPIVRARLFIDQLGAIASPENREVRLVQGSALLAIGLFKKVVLGDSFALIASAGHNSVNTLSAVEAWLTTLGGTFEMYFDFSGYSDMAFGVAMLLGVTLVRNFNAPFRALSITDFWQRWHISLSKFITTYLYTPLLRTMGRVTIHKSAFATLIAMMVAGLWHGAAWTFLLFYALHGACLGGYQYWKRRKRPLSRPVAAVVTFAFINLTFLIARAVDVPSAVHIVSRMWQTSDVLGLATMRAAIASDAIRMLIVPVLFGSVTAFVGPTADELAARFRPSQRAIFAIMAIVLVAYMFMSSSTTTQFRYRDF